MRIFIVISRGADKIIFGRRTGILIDLAANEDLLVYSGVEILSDDNSVIRTAGGSNIIIGPDASVVGFSGLSSRPTLLLGETFGGRDDVYISEGASVFSLGFGINSDFDSKTVTNHGSISSQETAINLNGSFNHVINYESITSDSAIGVRVFGNGKIMNFGDVAANDFGLVLRDGNGDIFNSGTVQSEIAIYMGGSDNPEGQNIFTNTGDVMGLSYGVCTISESAMIVNSGLISSTNSFVSTIYHVNSDLTESYFLQNSGEIISGGNAYKDTLSVDTIVNSGLIQGVIDLDGGDDIYNGKTGTVTGAVTAGEGADTLIGGDEDNLFYGTSGDNIMRGRGGEDEIIGGTDDDTIYGGLGNDTLSGGDGLDSLRGGEGHDDIAGGAGDDMLRGGFGDDTLSGGRNSDTLLGSDGNDTLSGGNGIDVLNGGRGDDSLAGGGGADVFVFARQAGHDIVTDFENNVDELDFSAFGTASIADLKGAAENVSGGVLFDLSLLGGDGSVMVEGVTKSQLNDVDLII